MASVGQELLNVPFGEMITEMALAIAEGQHALDMNSINVAQILAATELPEGSVVLAIEQPVDEEGVPNDSPTLVYNDGYPMNLLTYGLEPRFYEFSESIIEVKMAITMMAEATLQTSCTNKYNMRVNNTLTKDHDSGFIESLLFGKSKTRNKTTTSAAYSSTYNAKYSARYSFKEHGTSLLRTTLRPVPPPQRAIPTIKTTEKLPPA